MGRIPAPSPAPSIVGIDRVAKAVGCGQLSGEAAKVFLGVIQTRLKAIEVTDFEARLRQLEALVEMPRGAGRR